MDERWNAGSRIEPRDFSSGSGSRVLLGGNRVHRQEEPFLVDPSSRKWHDDLRNLLRVRLLSQTRSSFTRKATCDSIFMCSRRSDCSRAPPVTTMTKVAMDP